MRSALLVLALTLAGFGSALAAEADRGADWLRAVLGGAPLRAEDFADSFLAQVPLAEVQRVIARTAETVGPPEAVERTDEGYRVRSATHEMSVLMSLDARGRIAALLLRPPLEIGRTAVSYLEELKALPGETAVLVLEDGKPLFAHRAQDALAVGSAYKLGILAALAADIKAGKRRWEEVVRLEPRHLSLPSGTLQTFPIGAPLTLHSLATLMISQSDNTAADLLLDVVGRPAVAELLGIDFVLKTRELFQLKADGGRRERFLAADAAGRDALVAELDGLPVTPEGGSVPHVPGLEWYVPAERLCALMESVGGLDMVGLNPGPAAPADWQQLAFKGGSETGVLNLTTRVQRADGRRYCVVFTWNGPDRLDEAKAAMLYGAALARLARP